MVWRRACGPLLDLDEIRQRCGLVGQVSRGVRTIPLGLIVGTVDRASDFDRCFRPLRRHLRPSLNAVRRAYSDGAVPTIDVVTEEGSYFVSDGHKRVSAARAAGAEYVDADVIELFRPGPQCCTGC